MEVWRPEAAKTELTAFATVLGVPTCRASSFVDACLASLDQEQSDIEETKSNPDRFSAFRTVFEAAPSARSGPSGLGLAEAARAVSEASTGPFRIAPYDVKGALFLVSALDFGLDEASAIFGSDAVGLSRRLEQLLDQIDELDERGTAADGQAHRTPPWL